MKRWVTSHNGGLWILGLAITAALSGEQLPIKTYTTADGLPSNTIYKIVADSHGLLWFCTPEGLARFDGYSFKTYSRNQGIPSNNVRYLLETRTGQYWVGTSRGLGRFYPAAADGRKFQPKLLGNGGNANSANSIYEDRAGTIWVATWDGLYRLPTASTNFERVDVGPHTKENDGTLVWAILEDSHGDLWVGTDHGLYRREPGGKLQRFMQWLEKRSTWVISLFEDRDGRLWVGTRGEGLYSVVRDSLHGLAFTFKAYTAKDGVPAVRIRTVVQAHDGTLRMATNEGLAELSAAVGTARFRTYTTAHGLSEVDLITMADKGGDLWIGSGSAGVMRILRNGFTTYDSNDGLGAAIPVSVFGSVGEKPLFLARNPTQTEQSVSVFDGERFRSVKPNVLPVGYLGWRSGPVAIHGRAGDWWFATGEGLVRFPGVPLEQLGRTRPIKVYTAHDGLLSSDIVSIFEDSRGDIWIVTSVGNNGGLSRWVRATNTLQHYSSNDLPVRIEEAPVLAEDHSGNIWFQPNLGVFVRYRQGRFERTNLDGREIAWTQSIFSDAFGRLWIGDGEFGLIRIDDPDAEHLKCSRYTVALGLSSNYISCLTGDKWGRIYACTGRGIDRLDPVTGRIKHYGKSDGVPSGDFRNAHTDPDGTLWFATQYQIARFIPEPDLPETPAEVKISALRIRGIAYPVSDLGETVITGLTLPSDRNQVQIDFTGLGFRSDELRYQFMLEGADGDWGAPTNQRTVNYASLSPGGYRFLVRAATMDGVVNSAPASVTFRILPPLWQRWWFLLLTAFAILAIAHFLHRSRLKRLLDLERIRTRIATDLHDDIGASLSQIALLSELAGQRADSDGKVAGPLGQIGGISRELVDSMSDIVWSVDPRKDSLANLAQRMRTFATDVLSTRDIELKFHAPPSEHDLKLDVHERRQVLLIFKEAVNNIVRHAHCTEVEIELSVSHDSLTLSVRDNGRGFDPRRVATGHGLASMRARTEKLGGTFTILHEPGTCLGVWIPSGNPSNPWRRFLRKRAVRRHRP